jgi:hypothetical protein
MADLTDAQKDFIRLDVQNDNFRQVLEELIEAEDFTQKLTARDIIYIESNSKIQFKGKYLYHKRAAIQTLMLQHPSLRSKTVGQLAIKLKFYHELEVETQQALKNAQEQQLAIENKKEPRVEEVEDEEELDFE